MGSFSNNDEYGSQKRHLLLFYYLFFWFIFYELSSDYSIRGQIGNAEVMVCITYICLNCQMQVNFLRNEFLGTECKFWRTNENS